MAVPFYTCGGTGVYEVREVIFAFPVFQGGLQKVFYDSALVPYLKL